MFSRFQSLFIYTKTVLLPALLFFCLVSVALAQEVPSETETTEVETVEIIETAETLLQEEVVPPVQYLLSIVVVGTGSVSSFPAGINCPENCSLSFGKNIPVILTATAGENFSFTGWGGACAGTEACVVTMSEAKEVTATFTEVVVQYPVHVTVVGTGVVTSSPAGMQCGETCSTNFDNGTSVTLTAIPDDGYTFSGWSGDLCSGTETCILTLSAAANATAIFETIPEEAVVTSEEAVPEEKTEDFSQDYQLYKKYLLYQKYEKRELYRQYKRYTELAGRYPWENKKAEKKALKKLKSDYKKYRKKPHKYPHLRGRASDFTQYYSIKAEYFSLKPYTGYGEYARFDRDEYGAYKEYGAEVYRAGYDRYMAAMAAGKVTDRGDADIDSGPLGPEITVGIFNYIPKDLRDNPLSIKADKAFQVIDQDGVVLATVQPDTKVRVKYDGEKRLKIYYSGTDVTLGRVPKEVSFVPTAENKDAIIFDVSRPSSSFDHYRGAIKLRYYDSPQADGDRIWVINTIALEQYIWGMGEITGVGPDEYDNVMATVFRTYGYWKIKWSTKYADQGFKVDATAASQVYHGYDWEVTHPDIRKAAEATRGKLVMYDREVALTPYSSWTDGATRRFEDGHWGRSCKKEESQISQLYPWLNAVRDERGKNESKNTCTLAAEGNHMVGLSANGSVRMAKYDSKTFDAILEHYYSGIDLVTGY